MEIAIDLGASEKAGYTGNNGLYVKADLDVPSKDVIAELATRLGINVDKGELHTTVMYSKEPVIPAMAPIYDNAVIAVGAEVKHWIGHNDKRYLVLGLQCAELISYHASYVRAGAKPTFVPYAPYITLSNDIAMSEEFENLIKVVNAQLNRFPLRLRLTMCPPEDLH